MQSGELRSRYRVGDKVYVLLYNSTRERLYLSQPSRVTGVHYVSIEGDHNSRTWPEGVWNYDVAIDDHNAILHMDEDDLYRSRREALVACDERNRLIEAYLKRKNLRKNLNDQVQF